MRTLTMGFLILSSVLAVSSSYASQSTPNMVVNSDFNQGTAGFTSEYPDYNTGFGFFYVVGSDSR